MKTAQLFRWISSLVTSQSPERFSMQLIKEKKGLILLLCLILSFSGCSISDSSSGADSVAQDVCVSITEEYRFPFEDKTTDITPYFKVQEEIFSDKSTKESLVLDRIDATSLSKAQHYIDVGEQHSTQTMALHFTWKSPARTLYIGLYNETTDHYFIAMFIGGAISGLLDLAELPDGQYTVVMCGSDNENMTAVMNYQFFD